VLSSEPWDLALVGWDRPQGFDEHPDLFASEGCLASPNAWRVVDETGVWPPRSRWTDRPDLKAAAAIRAHVVENLLDAASAKRAFVRTDLRVGCFGRQIFVAQFAVRAKLEHQNSASLSAVIVPPRQRDSSDAARHRVPLEVVRDRRCAPVAQSCGVG
jgi:hypothetical protein